VIDTAGWGLAGWGRVDDARPEAEPWLAISRDVTLALAKGCIDRSIHFTTFSTDIMFDGRPYIAGDDVRPLNTYGQSKSKTDHRLLSYEQQPLIVRIAAFFSARDPRNFTNRPIKGLCPKQAVNAPDCRGSPAYFPDLVRAVLDLVIDGECGLWHVVNAGDANWTEFGRDSAASVGLRPHLVPLTPGDRMGWRAQRPAAPALRGHRDQTVPAPDEVTGQFVHAFKVLQ
jgi:dTDP-4-dehydrorhamnose reductase